MAPLQSIHNQQPAAARSSSGRRRERTQPTTIGGARCVEVVASNTLGESLPLFAGFRVSALSFRFLPFFIVRSSKARCPGMWPG